MNVVIVESAAKAKSINKYLGKDYKVLASYGHVRDLPSKNGSVEPDNDFEMHWDTDAKSSKILREITDAVKGADKLILATDPDREGEAISWHILQVLEKRRVLKGVEVERVAFNAVTKQAVLDAIAHPRELDQPLVSAYLARRALDYLVGFTLSPVLWRKLPGSRSAGRVQSVALRLICDRETEIEAFKSDEYWSIQAELKATSGDTVLANLVRADGKRLDKLDIKNEEMAMAIKTAIEGQAAKIASVEAKEVKRNPYAPFTTSTLQQEASRKLGFSASRTMQVAQKLYEGVDLQGETVGLITYMRTDGVQIIPEAIGECRNVIEGEYGKQYLPPSPREYKTKAKNAQEAHEAVRPTSFARLPNAVAKYVDEDGAKLYKLIWQRAVASQMAHAEMERTTVEFEIAGRDGKPYGLRAVGTVITFDGFLKLYDESRDDSGDEDDRRLPAMSKGETLDNSKINAEQHFTQPPPRFTEATLVKRMEELGIGRPSTYASTLAVLRDRDYVRMDKKRLIPEDKGRLVTAFLASFFTRYVQYDFTAGLEEKLDLISDDKLEWKQVLKDFWTEFTSQVHEIKDLRITEVLDALNEILGPHIFPPKESGGDPRKCDACGDGQLSLKVGKFGAFIGCSNYPDCKFTRQFTEGDDKSGGLTPDGKELGLDPVSGLMVSARSGRFGPYVQLGDTDDYEKGEKPKRSSIPKGWNANELDLELALKLLSLPREIGMHPESGQPIKAGLGRYGPFVQHERTYANLGSIEEVFEVGINRAVTLIAEKAAGGGRGARGGTVLKDLGEHPDGGGKIEVMSGRYGPYVKHGKVNATISKTADPEQITVEEAVALIAERAAKTGAKKKAPAKKKAAAKKPAAKKAAAKKPAAKKPAAKKAPAKKTPAAKADG